MRSDGHKSSLDKDSFYKSLFADNQEIMFLINPETFRIEDCNAAACRFYGYSYEEILQYRITDFNTLPDDMVINEIRLARGQKRRLFYSRHRLANGQVRDVEVRLTPVTIEDREFLLSIITNTTECRVSDDADSAANLILEKTVAERTYLLKEMNAKLEELNEQLSKANNLNAAILESIPGFLYVYDDTGKLIKWNKKHEEMTGYTTEELSHMTMDDWYEGEDAVRVAAAVREVLSKSYGEVEAHLLTKGGGKLRIRCNGVRLDITGRTYFTGVGVDITRQEKDEEALREKTNYLESLLNYANTPIIVWDSDLNIKRFNRAFEVLSGRKESEVLGKRVDILFPADKKNLFTELVRKTSTGDRWETVEIEISHVNGLISTLLWNSANIYAPDGITVEATIAQGHNITIRKKQEQALRESERQFRHAVEEAPIPIMLHSEDGEVIKISRTWTDITGYTIEDIPTTAIWSGKTRNANKKDMQLALKDIFDFDQRQSEGEYSIITKNGNTQLWDYYSAYIGKMQSGLKLAMSVAIDVTESRKLEIALIQEKKLLETTMISVGDGVISTDAEGKIVFLNRVAEMLTGWRLEEAKGRPTGEVFEIIHEFTRIRCPDIVRKVLETGQTQEMDDQTILISKNGIERPVEDSAAPIVQENGEVVGVVLVFRDYTEKKQKQDEIVFLSYHDQLTGLYNRRFYEEELKRLDTVKNLPLTLVMADINGLKLTNDAFGHKAGDLILEKISEILINECRNDEIISRIGGDEFVILLPRVSAAEARVMIDRINKSVSTAKIENAILSISIGFAVKTTAAEDMNAVFKEAEDDMYRHKLSESSSMRSNTIDLIMNSLYEKNHREMLHSKRVSVICEAMATQMKFSQDDINRIRTAGLMHDIGKIAIVDTLLNKVGSLNRDEWDEIKRHSEIGYRILSSANEFSEIADYVLAHHEKWDGSGYPKGLSGEDIPLEARIIAVADSFDAMTSDRAYRKGMSQEDAVKEVRRCAGSQFDPAVVEVFIEKVIEKGSL